MKVAAAEQMLSKRSFFYWLCCFSRIHEPLNTELSIHEYDSTSKLWVAHHVTDLSSIQCATEYGITVSTYNRWKTIEKLIERLDALLLLLVINFYYILINY